MRVETRSVTYERAARRSRAYATFPHAMSAPPHTSRKRIHTSPDEDADVDAHISVGCTFALKKARPGSRLEQKSQDDAIMATAHHVLSNHTLMAKAYAVQAVADRLFREAGVGKKLNARFGKEEYYISDITHTVTSEALRRHDATIGGDPNFPIEIKCSRPNPNASSTVKQNFAVTIVAPSKLEVKTGNRAGYLQRARADLSAKMSSALMLARLHHNDFHVIELYTLYGKLAIDFLMAYAAFKIEFNFEAGRRLTFNFGGKICKKCKLCPRTLYLCNFLDEIDNETRTAEEVIKRMFSKTEKMRYMCHCTTNQLVDTEKT